MVPVPPLPVVLDAPPAPPAPVFELPMVKGPLPPDVPPVPSEVIAPVVAVPPPELAVTGVPVVTTPPESSGPPTVALLPNVVPVELVAPPPSPASPPQPGKACKQSAESANPSLAGERTARRAAGSIFMSWSRRQASLGGLKPLVEGCRSSATQSSANHRSGKGDQFRLLVRKTMLASEPVSKALRVGTVRQSTKRSASRKASSPASGLPRIAAG